MIYYKIEAVQCSGAFLWTSVQGSLRLASIIIGQGWHCEQTVHVCSQVSVAKCPSCYLFRVKTPSMAAESRAEALTNLVSLCMWLANASRYNLLLKNVNFQWQPFCCLEQKSVLSVTRAFISAKKWGNARLMHSRLLCLVTSVCDPKNWLVRYFSEFFSPCAMTGTQLLPCAQ